MSKAKGDRERAEAQFDKKLQAQAAGAKAMSEYEAAGAAVRARTAKLRALRLAKEAADKKAAGEPQASETPAVKAAAVKKKKAASQEKPALSDWLATQRAQGRRG